MPARPRINHETSTALHTYSPLEPPLTAPLTRDSILIGNTTDCGGSVIKNNLESKFACETRARA